jgi:hypothetical protein
MALVLYWCISKCFKLSGLNKHIFIVSVFLGKEFRNNLAGCSIQGLRIAVKKLAVEEVTLN